MSEKPNNPNRLINEKSPYLLQHAHNPVDWYSWGEEAFQKARDEDKPIFLSIGYSTCYWCHVMEREVFEVEEIAKEMNRIFVNIKVDREERPDVDRVYMSALQSMTGSGGWPMSMFLNTDLKPFYGGTYIPPRAKYGMSGFEELILSIETSWKTRRDEINKSGELVINHIKEASANIKTDTELTEDILLKGAEQFTNGFDEDYGGFGSAPKFPRPPGLNFLMRIYNRFSLQGLPLAGRGKTEKLSAKSGLPDEALAKSGGENTLRMLIRTLLQMARGGMYDHLGGGFHRYSVDRFWRVPHFEKMLYDQAQLTINYLEAYQVTNDKYFAGIARDILQYVSLKLTDKDGCFYSAEDAESIIPPHKGGQGEETFNKVGALQSDNEMEDLSSGLSDETIAEEEASEKEEGAFYVWEKKEIDELLGKDAEILNYYMGVYEHGNAPAGSDPHSVFTDKNILYLAHSVSETSNKFELSTDETVKILRYAEDNLFAAREKRPLPHLDDKILTSWNGLMISAYAKAYQVLGEPEYLESAMRSADFIIKHLYRGKTLLHRWRDGEAKFSGTLEDYAYFIQALIDLYESCFDEKYLDIASGLMETTINDFYDNENGGFYDTTGKDKSILVRTKEDYDSAEPTGNSISVVNLLRLSYITGNNDLYDKAYKSLQSFSDKLTKMPYAMPQMLVALDYFLHKPKQIIIAGKKNDETAMQMITEVYERFIPGKILIFIDTDSSKESKTFASKIISKTGKTAAYVCENFACKLPVNNVKELIKLL